MKESLIQPFTKAQKNTAYLLIETEDELFLQLTELDDMDAFYADTLTIELEVTVDITSQLVKILHANGLELVKYRELLRETHVEYGYLDDEPGTCFDIVILHVTVECTNRDVPHTSDQTVEFVTLESYAQNLRDTGMPAGLLEASVSHLLLERSSF